MVRFAFRVLGSGQDSVVGVGSLGARERLGCVSRDSRAVCYVGTVSFGRYGRAVSLRFRLRV